MCREPAEKHVIQAQLTKYVSVKCCCCHRQARLGRTIPLKPILEPEFRHQKCAVFNIDFSTWVELAGGMLRSFFLAQPAPFRGFVGFVWTFVLCTRAPWSQWPPCAVADLFTNSKNSKAYLGHWLKRILHTVPDQWMVYTLPDPLWGWVTSHLWTLAFWKPKSWKSWKLMRF